MTLSLEEIERMFTPEDSRRSQPRPLYIRNLFDAITRGDVAVDRFDIPQVFEWNCPKEPWWNFGGGHEHQRLCADVWVWADVAGRRPSHRIGSYGWLQEDLRIDDGKTWVEVGDTKIEKLRDVFGWGLRFLRVPFSTGTRSPAWLFAPSVDLTLKIQERKRKQLFEDNAAEGIS